MKIVNKSEGPSAFSLVETALAIGILSFSLIAMMGLIPVALQTSRHSIDRILELHMLQAVRANLMNVAYSQIPDEGEFFFDAEGMELNGDTSPENIRYRVDYLNHGTTAFPGEQSSTRLVTSMLEITNVVTGSTKRTSLHLPDNGF